ncbi:hypothetical protein GCM10022237_09950 [Nocardioides ginsengisoli]|uniref:DUF222 domain-containing protein n=1 Tax=Nocardioides ginsengisoli TaxID=363868 RepID=A0ABW3W2W9_9ACTN
MVTDRAVAGLTTSEILEFVEGQHAARLDVERNILEAAYRWALLHQPERGGRGLPTGGAGTPLVSEYARATLGARIQTSPFGARRLMADAADLVVRLPQLWAGIDAGTTRVSHARHVAAATRELSAEQTAWVDAEVAEVADGRLAWARFEALVEGKVAAAGPELARAREEAAARERCARMSRVNKHGMATFIVHADAATIAGIDAAVTAMSATLADAMPDSCVNDRRVVAIARLANPAHHLHGQASPVTPKVKLYLHLYADSPIPHPPPDQDPRPRERNRLAGRTSVPRDRDLA